MLFFEGAVPVPSWSKGKPKEQPPVVGESVVVAHLGKPWHNFLHLFRLDSFEARCALRSLP